MSIIECYDAADPVLALHQLEASVHFVEAQTVRDERLDVDFAGQVAVDQERHLVAPLDPAERGAGHTATGDQKPGHDVEGLPLPRNPGDRAHAPAHTGSCNRL